MSLAPGAIAGASAGDEFRAHAQGRRGERGRAVAGGGRRREGSMAGEANGGLWRVVAKTAPGKRQAGTGRMRRHGGGAAGEPGARTRGAGVAAGRGRRARAVG